MIDIDAVPEIKSDLYGVDYKPLSLSEALQKLGGYKPKVANSIVKECVSKSEALQRENAIPKTITQQDAQVLSAYTYDFGHKKVEMNPAVILSRELTARTPEGLEKIKDFLYLIMKVVRKLPITAERTMYRALSEEVRRGSNHYQENNIVIWPEMSFTSPDMNSAKASLSSKGKKASGTVFIISNGWGYDLQKYSLNGEKMCLIEPERQFGVSSVLPTGSLILVNLEMVDSPLLLPEVYGTGEVYEIK